MDLLAENGKNWREARVEFQRRLAFPFACLVFALVAVPLGAQPRRGGRAGGTPLSLLLIGLDYSPSLMGAGFGRGGKGSPRTGLWPANIAPAGLALILLRR